MTGIWKRPKDGPAVLAQYRELLRDWPSPSEQLTVSTSLGRTFVVACGPPEAPPVLLLHGSASNAASWMADVAALVDRSRIYAVDMVGEPGLSAPVRPPLGSGAYSQWLADVMDGLGVARAALVGVSLGGWLALEFATRNSGRVRALALLCPGGLGRTRNVLFWALPLMMLGAWGRKMVAARLLGAAKAATGTPEAAALSAFMVEVFKRFRPRTEPLPRISDEALRRLDMPVLAVLGARDAMIDSAGSRARLEAHVLQAQIVWLPEAGHLLTGQGRTIARFLAAGSAA